MPIKVCQTESHTSTSSTTSKTADTHVDDHKQTTDQSSHEQKEKTAENRENISQESFKHSVHSQESSKISGSSSAQKAEEGKLSESEKGRKSEEESRYVSSKMSESNRSASASIPIKKREGLFFKDSFFETAWKDYQDAMRDVLTQWGDDTASYRKDKAGSFSEDLSSSYRKLRSSDMREENQAISSTEDEHSYKVGRVSILIMNTNKYKFRFYKFIINTQIHNQTENPQKPENCTMLQLKKFLPFYWVSETTSVIISTFRNLAVYC